MAYCTGALLRRNCTRCGVMQIRGSVFATSAQCQEAIESSLTRNQWVWLALIQNDSTWFWAKGDGNKVAFNESIFQKWKRGEPNNLKSITCAGTGVDGWNNVVCSTSTDVLCPKQKPGTIQKSLQIEFLRRGRLTQIGCGLFPDFLPHIEKILYWFDEE